MKSTLETLADKPVSRRSLLKGAAAIGGSTLVTGFPTVWAQTIKDITLNHVGMSYAVLPDIARQASKDLGFKIDMSVTDQSGMTNRAINDPSSIDIADIEIWQTKLIVPQGVTQAIDVKKVKNWSQLTPLYTEGKFQGKKTSRQGGAPISIMYRDAIDATEFAEAQTEWATIVPSVFNADTLGLRPDLIKEPVDSWAALVSADYKGKTAIQNIPTNGIMDAIMALEASGERTFADKGNPTREDIEWVIARLIDLKRAGHFRALWSTFDESINLMASGEVVLQSMWSPAVTAVKVQGVNCVYQPLKEGYRGWGNGLALMSHLEGVKLEAAYEYLNWYNSGFVGAFIAKQGYYSANPETAKAALSENERGFFYEGKAATADITNPSGEKTNAAGEVRDGGSFEERFSKVAVWNNLINEAELLYAKWNEFSAA
ncbi:ABC transporter substrate-binding protein [Agrobacterium rubi]|uniref:Extracellular solute-binding protein n=2 Tax=Rhizobium/Agrobacterium group TaxID=227290 RepID=A0AAE7UT75_9HYPH|nr:PotD/PotF family extracellular solute-binding protein [Agrobacterium rubi]MBN7809220.1 extracellular solute-binding protein [Agrobacterium rosae]NTE89838.1 extracellular solute-binding protein [Agrobacterium rubi]NTF05312.1 extracellular solute-binding protein [Agrobacterium rubi]NTF39756.1 extracellular solute-binding protein [Agrobacterium rubi]OCJ44995.1 ABC transporter substrate-binding protein [Agrobacterium rubi]